MIQINLRELRLKKGLSQADLARLSGVGNGSLCLFENNKIHALWSSNLDRICKVLECQPCDIFILIPDDQPIDLEAQKEKEEYLNALDKEVQFSHFKGKMRKVNLPEKSLRIPASNEIAKPKRTRTRKQKKEITPVTTEQELPIIHDIKDSDSQKLPIFSDIKKDFTSYNFENSNEKRKNAYDPLFFKPEATFKAGKIILRKLESFRISKNILLPDLAKMLDISEYELEDIELYEKKVGFDIVEKLCLELQCKEIDLY